MARHDFKCNKCKLTFGFDSDIADINRFKKKLKRGVRCPECDDKWGEVDSNITQVLAVSGKARDIEKLRRSNAQASSDAKASAAKYASEVGTPEMVQVKRPKDGKMLGNVMPGKAVESIPKSAIDSLIYKQGIDPKDTPKK